MRSQAEEPVHRQDTRRRLMHRCAESGAISWGKFDDLRVDGNAKSGEISMVQTDSWGNFPASVIFHAGQK
jgi:hypothetical protein